MTTKELREASGGDLLHVEIIESTNGGKLQQAINKFIQGKYILDIQYQVTGGNGEYSSEQKALIIYEVLPESNTA